MLPGEDKLKEVIVDLAQIMRMQDWDITLVLVDEYQMRCYMNADHYDYAGCVKWYSESQEAVIRINVDHEKIKETDYQWYSTLVHEMHHIKLSELEDMFYNVTNDKFQRNLHDHMIETKVCELTRIFVSLHPVTNYIKE